MANILSLKSVADISGAQLVMDTLKGMSIMLHLLDNHNIKFEQFKNGQYFFDTNNVVVSNDKSKLMLTTYSLLQTVIDNRNIFSQQEIKEANTSRDYQELYITQERKLSKIMSTIISSPIAK